MSIILIIVFAGCINQPNSPKNNNLNQTSRPTIFLDDDNQLSIVWMKYDDALNTRSDIEINYPRYISIIDNDGNYLIKSKEIIEYPKRFLYYNFLKDAEGNYHFISLKFKNSTEGALFYTKFDTNLKQIVLETQLSEYDYLKGFPELAINSDDEINIIWEQPFDKGEIYFKKIDNNGNDLIKTVDISNDQDNVDTNPFILVDTSNAIHIKWRKKDIGNYYMKLSNDGRILINATPLEAVAVLPGYPVVRDDLGNLLYLGDYGVVDSKNNIHIYSQEFEEPDMIEKNLIYNKLDSSGNKLIENKTIYTQFRYDPQLKLDSLDNIHLVWEENNHIYYTKLDDDGNKLIDKMKIV